MRLVIEIIIWQNLYEIGEELETLGAGDHPHLESSW